MKKILIIGAGAMGAAFTFPCLDNNNKVTLSEPYDLKLIRKLSLKKKFHPVLKINLPKKLTIKKFSKEILNYKLHHINRPDSKIEDDYFLAIEFQFAIRVFFKEFIKIIKGMWSFDGSK